jgi:hypothetical protein
MFCMSTGKRTDDTLGDWVWAVACGKQVLEFEGNVEENRAVGEIQCNAFRKGDSIDAQKDGLLSGWYPCQYLSLAVCKCAPEDVFPFDLDPPECPCEAGKAHCRYYPLQYKSVSYFFCF